MRVAVVGAGMAGLSCADALVRAGCSVTVYDKSRAPGGRMSTRRGEAWQCDHGAQYFTARDPAFRAEVARWEAAGAAALWTPRLAVLGGPDRPGMPVARFVGVPRMTAPAALLAAGHTVHTGVTVTGLEKGADGWQLRSDELGLIAGHVDAVVLALPAPQAARLLEAAQPPLPALLAQCAVPMQACWAAMLRFDAPLDLPFDAAFVNAGPLRWIARDGSKPGRPGGETWLLHASAAWSEAHLERDALAVTELLVQAFVDLGGAVPPACVAHRWRYAIAEAARDAGVSEPAWLAQEGVGLCGDWRHGGAVEGAWLSGHALARRMTGQA